MQEDQGRLSRDALTKFLEFAASKGLMKKATAGAYKTACGTVLGILDDNEAADLSKTDLENVLHRHRNLAAGRIPPKTLKTYETRVRAAVNSFIEYSKDPSSWKTAVKQRSPRSSGAKRIGGTASTISKEPEDLALPSQPAIHVDLQIHISPETTGEQIEQIFASMRRHLYGTTTNK